MSLRNYICFLFVLSFVIFEKDLNLDLVQFPCAVVVHEVRIVPLGTRVVADVPGGVRLGYATSRVLLVFVLEIFDILSRPSNL